MRGKFAMSTQEIPYLYYGKVCLYGCALKFFFIQIDLETQLVHHVYEQLRKEGIILLYTNGCILCVHLQEAAFAFEIELNVIFCFVTFL